MENFTSGYNGSKAFKRFSLISKEAFKVLGWKSNRDGKRDEGGVFEHQCKLLKFVRNKTLSVNFSLDYRNNQVNFKDEAKFSGHRTIDLKLFIKINSLC